MSHLFSTSLLSARQVSKMIGQQVALNQIEQAIYAEDRKLKIVLVHAQGGLGKTRLLEEVDIKLNGDWSSFGNTINSQIIDVIDVRLHDRNRFIKELRNAHPNPFEFSEYESAQDTVTLLRASGAQPVELQKAEQKAIDAFLRDLSRITRNNRLIWIIDTVEQLSYITSEWLLEHDALLPEDLENRTHQWLKELIQTQDLDNITLIMAGRGIEGQSFFASIREAVEVANLEIAKCDLVDIDLIPLSRSETRDYFRQLAQDWRSSTAININPRTREQIASQFEAIASDDNDRADVLWFYTAGIPVRLALYAQIIIEEREIPKPLRFSYEKAIKEAGTDDPNKPTPSLSRLQWIVEDQFIDLLFRNPTDLRTRVLQTLVRAPRGLSAEQLHFVLDNKERLSPADWQNDAKRLKEITDLLQTMQDYYLVKNRSSWTEIATLRTPEEEKAATFRLGLQDEIYRIYAEHMAPHVEPQQDEVMVVWNELNVLDKQRYYENHDFEKRERQELYRQLSSWAEHQHQKYLSEKRRLMSGDERDLERFLVPDRLRTFYFEELGTNEISQRLAINEAITTFEIEAMVYELLQNPERNINESYIDVGTAHNKANESGVDFWAQLEMWRITHDRYNLKFADFTESQQAAEHQETMIEVLHRAVTQEDVSRWIKRFVLRHDYPRALALADHVEQVILSLPKGTRLEKRVWHSWNHSLVHAERRIWACYARIHLSQDVPDTLVELHEQIGKLELLLEYNVRQTAIIRQDEEDHEEQGFRGIPEENIPDHPAYVRVRRLLSLAYDIIGYGYNTLGQVRNAVKYYGQSLYHIRGDKGVDSHRGYVLNDLSKALSDMGRTSVTVCLDGLKLRRQLAEEVPLAVSYNTLALIYDDMGRYEDAPELAAKAIAYLRRAGAKRELAMSLQQLGESLRHLAIRAQRGEKAQATPDRLYTASEVLLREAKGIFSETKEVYRLVMVLIEIGSLYRDRLRNTPIKNTLAAYQRGNDYREAVSNLIEAKAIAHDKNLLQLEVDAGVNLAWAHFHVSEYQKAEEMINSLEGLIGQDYFITATNKPDINDEALVDIFWVLRQMSKLQSLRGQIALAQFEDRRKIIARSFSSPQDIQNRHLAIHNDKESQRLLEWVAECYTLAIGYAHIIFLGGRMVGFILDDLYEQLKAFNHLELDDFCSYVIALERKYSHLDSKHVLNLFLHEFFGVPHLVKEHVKEK